MKALLLLGALAAPVVAVSQESPAVLDPITTTASGTGVAASRVLASQIVITREQIEHAQANDLAELLQFHAGLEIERSGGPGQFTQLRIRGGEADHTLILVDGVRINPATGGPTLQNIPTDAIERIEIVKGPRSTLYGSDAMTGTINLITRKSGAFNAAVRSGRYDTTDGSVFFAAGDADARFSASAGAQRSNGLPICAGSTLSSAYDRQSLSVNGDLKLGGVNLGARAFDSRGTSDYVDFCGSGGNNPVTQDYRQQTLAADATFAPTASWQSIVTASRVLDDLRQNENPDYITTTRPQLEWRNVLTLDEGHRASIGLSYAREKANVLSFGSALDETRSIKTLSAQDEWSRGAQQVLLAAAVTDHDAFGTRGTWNAEYGYDLNTQWRLVATAGRGFRAPNTFERLSGFGGNPNLKPEFTHNYELGAIYHIAAGHSLDLRAFRTDTTDLIAFIEGTNVNVPDFRNQGAELSYRFVNQNWTLTATGLVQNPENRTTDTRLLRRAQRAMSAGLERRFGPHFLAISLLGSGDKADSDFSTFPSTAVILPGYALVNVSGGFEVLKGLRIQAKVENALDKGYQTAFGYNQSKAAVSAGLRYQF